MKNIQRSFWIGCLIFLISIFVLISPWIPQTKAEMKPRLAILPFLIERKGICPFCKGIYQKGEIFPGSQDILTRLLYQKVETIQTFNILPLEKAEETLSPLEKKRFEEKPIPTSIEIGQRLNVEFLFVGFLFRFEERIGSSLGVEKPASVGFDLHLIRLKDGMNVWKGKFDETQRPLSENLLKIGSFFRRRASWLTAEELVSVGMDEMLRRLPGIKELEE